MGKSFAWRFNFRMRRYITISSTAKSSHVADRFGYVVVGQVNSRARHLE